MKPLFILSLLIASATAAQTPPATIEGLPIGVLPAQALPASGCAAFLWTKTGTRTLVAMAGADPAKLRLSLGGGVTDLPRTEQRDRGGFGFAGTTQYQAGDVTAVLTMSVETRGDLKQGAAIPEATLRIDRAGQDSVVVPVAGLIGCAA